MDEGKSVGEFIRKRIEWGLGNCKIYSFSYTLHIFYNYKV
ncbi:hypothetical protein SAMN05660841_03340 [Sphingobacterium nematocida]|uniref:Uncharacterized protein n=1 Tax=Sphingobacterium nematocida TaxID=1513896 RepID=A0A1T5FLC3_9SPHI|nr:hypothetical protein SAMN05660841_03340 [Sphingobacterium nematocida]